MAKQVDSLDPVCALHGKRWSEHEDGRCLYCSICFNTLTPAECAMDEKGQRWDVCKGVCAAAAGVVERSSSTKNSSI